MAANQEKAKRIEELKDELRRTKRSAERTKRELRSLRQRYDDLIKDSKRERDITDRKMKQLRDISKVIVSICK
jgi:uncharacterized coiled-coil protein SlyX